MTRPAFSVTVDASSLDGLLNGIVEGANEAARPAAQAGAQVLYDAAKANVAAIRKVTGNLDRSIYQAYSKDSTPGRAVYNVSWNPRIAPHGGLVEYGYLQRYMTYQGNDGKVRIMVRPGAQGQPKPAKRAPQSVKDAYYVPLPGGPRQVPAKAYMRRAADKLEQARRAMTDRFFGELESKGLVK